MGGNNLTFNGTQDLSYTDAGRITAGLYVSGLDDSATYPQNFLYTDNNGQFLSAPGHLAGMLPVGTEVSGAVSAVANYLTPVDVSAGISTVTPPTGVSDNTVFEIVDSRANASTNNITVGFSGVGENLYGTLSDFVINTDGAFSRFRYLGGTIGWIVEK
jgi:hypothetical protein